MTPSRHWLPHYGNVAHTLSCPEITLYDAVAATAARIPEAIAWDFLDTSATYRVFLANIDACASALAALGLPAGQRILISMPTSAPAVSPRQVEFPKEVPKTRIGKIDYRLLVERYMAAHPAAKDT